MGAPGSPDPAPGLRGDWRGAGGRTWALPRPAPSPSRPLHPNPRGSSSSWATVFSLDIHQTCPATAATWGAPLSGSRGPQTLCPEGALCGRQDGVGGGYRPQGPGRGFAGRGLASGFLTRSGSPNLISGGDPLRSAGGIWATRDPTDGKGVKCGVRPLRASPLNPLKVGGISPTRQVRGNLIMSSVFPWTQSGKAVAVSKVGVTLKMTTPSLCFGVGVS